jgi:hypothetical protein
MEKSGGLIFVLLFFLLLFGSATMGLNQAHAADNFYYSDGQKIPLKLSPDKVAVRFRLAPAVVGSQLQDLIQTPKGQKVDKNLIIVPLKGKTNDVPGVLARLKENPGVEVALPVFDAPGADMVITDEFIAKFKPDVSQGEVCRINARYGVEIFKKAPWQANTYILRAPQASVLDIANRYHEMEEVEYSHPNFVRFLQLPVIPGASSQKRFVWGPDNKPLPRDFVVPKGAAGYRVMEWATLTRKELPPQLNSQIGPNAPVTKNVIKSEGFECGIPADFVLSGDPTWGATTYRKYEGARSAYCVGSSVPAPGPYPDDAFAWMTYGPFSLQDAQDARLGMRAWINTEAGYDFFWIVASTDGLNWTGYRLSGNWAGLTADEWLHMAVSFSDLSNMPISDPAMIGQSQVWFATIFESDYSVTYEGVYLDNIVLEKITGGYESITNDVLEHYQWSLSNNGQRWGTSGMDLKAVSAWGQVPATSNVTIAIIDEGVQLTHPDLMAKMVAGYDATGGGSGGGPSGNDAHGTNCAGIAAAVTNNTLGVAGVAKNCKIMPVRIAYSDEYGYWVTSDAWIADGISWAANHGADVLSNSWGGGSPAAVINDAITNAKTTGRGGKGCVVCFSSGNDNDAVSYPANLNNVLAVGAISPTGERKSPNSSDGEYWWGSNYGTELDLVAPGTLCYSTDITGPAGYWNGDYFPNFNGTSAACAHVAGVAGLVLSRNANMAADRVENALLSSATDLSTTGWDPQTGYGLVNAYGAVLKASGSSTPILQLLLFD